MDDDLLKWIIRVAQAHTIGCNISKECYSCCEDCAFEDIKRELERTPEAVAVSGVTGTGESFSPELH